MHTTCEWAKEPFEKSVTSRSWNYTEYGRGWDGCKDSAAIRALYEEEMALGAVPDWGCEIVERMMASPLPPCGHYTFPGPILQVCQAIGRQRCPDFVIGCYTAEAERKQLMLNYAYCLDAWLQGAPLEAVADEVSRRGDAERDWPAIAAAVYAALGERTEPRRIAVRRLVHRLRWWAKTLIWRNDARDRFVTDAWLGDVRGSARWGDYGNPGFADPYFAELEVPEVADMGDRIRRELPDGPQLLTWIESTWLCAPKAFRYLERIVLRIGAIGTDAAPDYGRPMLQCEDTYPDFDSQAAWFASFMARLDRWLAGESGAVPELGEASPVRHWLAGMLRLRLQSSENMRKMVAVLPHGRAGAQFM